MVDIEKQPDNFEFERENLEKRSNFQVSDIPDKSEHDPAVENTNEVYHNSIEETES